MYWFRFLSFQVQTLKYMGQLHGSLGRDTVFFPLKILLVIIAFEIIVASSQHYGLICIFFAGCLTVNKNLQYITIKIH